MEKKTIEQVESQLAEALQSSLKPVAAGYRAEVSLYEKGRKKRRTASADHWSPESGEVRIVFRREESPAAESEGKAPAIASSGSSGAEERSPVHDLVRALKRAESRPGYTFVALKWFRDSYLPEQGFAWATSDSTRQDVLRRAIEQRFVLTSKVANPKAPQFPVTAIRLNRSLPQVASILGEDAAAAPEFAPIEIGGDALSATILDQRR